MDLAVQKIQTISWKMATPKFCKELKPLFETPSKINAPADIEKFDFLFKDRVQEIFCVFWLNTSNIVVGYEVISVGILNASVVAAREVFRGAIVQNCANIIIAHNHPSGNKEPSNEDIQLTKNLVAGGKILGIQVFDHIIYTKNGIYSFVENRLI